MVYQQKRKEYSQLQQQIQSLQQQNGAMEQQIKAFKTDPKAIEKKRVSGSDMLVRVSLFILCRRRSHPPHPTRNNPDSRNGITQPFPCTFVPFPACLKRLSSVTTLVLNFL